MPNFVFVDLTVCSKTHTAALRVFLLLRRSGGVRRAYSARGSREPSAAGRLLRTGQARAGNRTQLPHALRVRSR